MDVTHINLIKNFEFKFDKIVERISNKTEKLKNRKTKLEELLENLKLGFCDIDLISINALNISLDKWYKYINGEDYVAFYNEDIFNLTCKYEVFDNNLFWDLIIQENLVDERNIFAFVRMIHYYWTDLENLNKIIDYVKQFIVDIGSEKEIFKIWKQNFKKIFGTKQKSLDKYLLESLKFKYEKIDEIYQNKALDIKEIDLVANLVQYEYIMYLMKNKINDDTIEIIFHEFKCFFIYSLKPFFREHDTRKVSKTLKEKRNLLLAYLIEHINEYKNMEVKSYYKKNLIEFLLNEQMFEDPRIHKWEDFPTRALNIFVYWLNERDIRFFFECLTDEKSDIHNRKDFWIQNADKIEESVFLLGVNNINKQFKLEINDFKKKYKDKFFDIGAVNSYFTSNVFILKIKNRIYIEFSEYANACYIYDYKDFCDKIRPLYNTVYNRRKLRKSELKQPCCITKFSHNPRWQEDLNDFIKINS